MQSISAFCINSAEISMFPHSQLWVFCSTHAWQISSNGLIAFILG